MFSLEDVTALTLYIQWNQMKTNIGYVNIQVIKSRSSMLQIWCFVGSQSVLSIIQNIKTRWLLGMAAGIVQFWPPRLSVHKLPLLLPFTAIKNPIICLKQKASNLDLKLTHFLPQISASDLNIKLGNTVVISLQDDKVTQSVLQILE